MKNSNTTLLAALLCGAAAGAALAVLFAPAKGSEVRSSLQENAEDLQSLISDKFDEMVESVSSKIKSKFS